MDLIVFVDRYAAAESGAPTQLPDLTGAILPDNAPALQAVGIHLLPDAAFGLQSERSEEHTSELQSLMRISYAVFCLKKKKTIVNSQEKIDKNTNTIQLHNT